MAANYPPGHPSIETIVREGICLENELNTRAFSLASSDEDAAIVMENRGAATNTQRGTDLKLTFRKINKDVVPKARGANLIGESPIRENFESSLTVRYHSMNQAGFENVLDDQQNVNFDIMDAEYLSMAKETSITFERSIWNQLAGNTAVNDTDAYPDYAWSCSNIVTNPDALHHFYARGASTVHSTETAVAADDTALIDTRQMRHWISRLRGSSVQWPIAPAKTPLGHRYVVLVDTEGMQQAKDNSPDGDFHAITMAQIQGGADVKTSALFTGEGFEGPEKTLWLEVNYLPFGLSGVAAGATTIGTPLSNVRRGLILGARAMNWLWAEAWGNGMHLGYTEFPVHRDLHVQIDSCFGGKTLIVNGERWGSAVFSYHVDATV